MAIVVSCPGCSRALRVSDEHAGMRAKCPHCQTAFLVPSVPGSPPEAEGDEPAFAPPGVPDGPQPGGDAPGSTTFDSSASPYASPQAPQTYGPPASQPQDVPGIMGVILGGVALVTNLFGCCCGPLVAVAVPIAIGGLITSFFGKGNLKIIGIAINVVSLVLAVVWVVIGIVIMVSDGAMEPM